VGAYCELAHDARRIALELAQLTISVDPLRFSRVDTGKRSQKRRQMVPLKRRGPHSRQLGRRAKSHRQGSAKRFPVQAGEVLRLRICASQPRPAKPVRAIAQVEGSGTGTIG
jgi:hypothetical protein